MIGWDDYLFFGDVFFTHQAEKRLPPETSNFYDSFPQVAIKRDVICFPYLVLKHNFGGWLTNNDGLYQQDIG
jgi:hypothetical protein